MPRNVVIAPALPGADLADPIRSVVPSPSSASPGEAVRWVGQGPFVLLLAVLALAPLPFGSNRWFAWDVNAVLLGAGLVWLAVVDRRDGLAAPPRWVLGPAVLVGVVLLWAVAQMLPGVPDWLQHPAYILARDALGTAVPIPGRIGAAPALTAAALMRVGTDAAAFWLAFRLAGGGGRGRTLVSCAAYACAAYSLWGLMAWAAGTDQVLWLPKRGQFLNEVTSTFVMRNAFALYACIGLACAADLAWRRVAAWRAREAGAWPVLLALACAGVVLLALLLTRSRAGVVLGLGSAGLLLALRVAQAVRHPGLRLAALGGLLLALGACALVFGGLLLSGRLGTAEVDTNIRLSLYGMILDAIRSRPLLGHGLGTFELVFPSFRTDAISQWQVWDKAHNAYLELAFGLGLPAAAALLAAVAWVVLACARSLLLPQAEHTAARVALCAALALGAVSFLDFTVQIQADSLLLFALLGAGAAAGDARMASVRRAR